jgi:pimeloyl-ACP methyl ester carboxylesterase
MRVARTALPGLICSAVAIAIPAGARAQAAPLAFGACQPTQVIAVTPALQCATLDVPFDRADPAAGSIALAVQRVAPSRPRVGVIVLLAGGPGQPALPAFESLLAPLASEGALAGYELVAFDQRGTGQSEGLQCPPPGASPAGGSFAAFLRALASIFTECGDALGATRAFYTSQESVEDLQALREALGGPPLSLLAVSYGGRVAGMFAREHPLSVARMVLDSPSPLSGSDALDRERLRALRRVLDEGICGAGACRLFSHDVFRDLTLVVAKLHRHPLRSTIYDSSGHRARVRVTEREVFRLLLALDVSQGVRELAPAAIAAAAHGDAGPLARMTHGGLTESGVGSVAPDSLATPSSAMALPPEGLAGQQSGKAPENASAISIPLFAATYCIENELPWSAASPVAGRRAMLRRWLAALPAGTTAPFSLATVAAAAAFRICMQWPPTPPAPPSPSGSSAIPALILSGEDDMRTPYEQDLAVAGSYSDARLLRIPDVGHSTVSTDRTGCAARAMIEFLTGGAAPAVCPGSTERQALPLAPSSLEKIHVAATRSRLAAQVAAAAAITVEDVLDQPAISGGGLRGGYWRPSGNSGLSLRGVIDVPGVAVSGTVSVSADLPSHVEVSGRLRVRGRLAGNLKLRGTSLSGHVGGALVHARLAAL